MRRGSIAIISLLNELQQYSQHILILPRYAKRSIAFMVDICLCALTVWLAFYLRLGEFISLSRPVLSATLISIAFTLPVFVILGLYRAIFRYSGLPAMLSVARAIAVYSLLYIGLIAVIGIADIPRTIGFIQPLLLFLTIGGSRLLACYWLGGVYQTKLQFATLPRALVYGAGNAGHQLASALNEGFEMRVLGFVDDDIHLQGRALNNIPIFPMNELGHLIESKAITHVLLAIPSASRRQRQEILECIQQFSVAVRTLPSLTALAEGRVTVSDLRDLDIDDLLCRVSVTPNRSLLTKNITGKVVLVTGAGGSIGSELCRQILKQSPSRLLLVEMHEYSLYSIHAELERSLPENNSSQNQLIVPLLGSVINTTRMREIIGTWQPDTIYHAAAYKHVPLVEHNIAEGVKNNVLGTLVTAQVAIKEGVSDFVLISTDKAVRPTNVMGASKRLAELCLQALFAEHASIGKTRLAMVRFGNVLGSSGSVIPRFQQQIRDGGPISLTHSEIIRFFMTIPEAAQLVIQAGAMAEGGDVFVLDMGEPVKIADLARRVVELSGLTVRDIQNPEGDIEINVIGLRPGEKLYEELLLGDDPLPTLHAKIMRAQDPFIPWDQLEVDLDILRIALENNDLDRILSILKRLVTGFKPSENIVDWVYAEQIRNVQNDGRCMKTVV